MLFQTPPFLKKDLPRLRDFLAFLPPEKPVAFEFRHETWRDVEVHEALRSRNAARFRASRVALVATARCTTTP